MRDNIQHLTVDDARNLLPAAEKAAQAAQQQLNTLGNANSDKNVGVILHYQRQIETYHALQAKVNGVSQQAVPVSASRYTI
jgi:hypothetical protein